MTRTGRPDSTRTSARTPPHDLDAERALLGSMMLSRDAIRAVSNVRPRDFYVPIHGTIYDVIVDLHLEDVIPDAVTVAGRVGEELERHGGKRFLLELAAETPASANAGYYAEVVERCSRQRQIITYVGEVAEAAYHGTDWHRSLADLTELANRNGVVYNPSTLEDVDLGPILRGEGPKVSAFWLKRNDGHALLYPGLVHDVHAEPSHGKTWLAILAVREVLEAGGSAIYIDYEDSPWSIVERLGAAGVAPELIDPDRFRYLRPSGPLHAVELAQIDAVIEELGAELLVLDGVAEALSRDGFDESSNAEVVAWGVRVPRHFADLGPAVLMLDHVVKDPAGRTRGARGAGAKLGLVNGASYELRLAVPFSRRKSGLIKLVLAKDRNGQVGSIGETVAQMPIQPRHDGAEVGLWLELPPPPEEFRPTGLMEKVSDHLRTAAVPHSAKLIVDAIRGKSQHVRQALALLVIDGYVAEEKDGRERLYRHVRTYRENGPKLEAVPDPGPDEPDPEPPPPELF